MPKKVLAVASGGGHWIQLYRMRPAWDGHDVTYATTAPGLRQFLSSDAADRGQGVPGYVVLPDANRWHKFRLVVLLGKIAILLLRVRPDCIITTGAAPGYFALRFGRLMGAKTVWVDSIANTEEMSMSGRLARPYADVWLTQWQHLASAEGPEFHGAVL